MDLKVYKKTRYQNIYKHKKNGNYAIMINKPVKSSISRINNEKIWKIEDAISIRDNPKIKLQKKAEITYKDNFDELWNKFMNYCKYEKKQKYNTYNKKNKIYKKYFKNKFNKPVSKLTREFLIKFIDDQDTTDKMKNNIIKDLKTFFNWCVYEEKCLIINPISRLPKYKTVKEEMKYWLPEHLNKILTLLNNEIEKPILSVKKEELLKKYDAWLIKLIIMIGFSLGDRIGETRALQFCKISKEFNTIEITNSINYDPRDKNYLGSTKTLESNDTLFVDSKLIDEILKFKWFLINEMDFDVDDQTPIFYNFSSNKPYTDTTLRKKFNRYIELSGVPKIRMYDLRHTLATTMMSEGYDMYAIQDRLRHKSIKTTIDTYGHVTMAKRKEIAEITGKYI